MEVKDARQVSECRIPAPSIFVVPLRHRPQGFEEAIELGKAIVLGGHPADPSL
jgi:hypothetical protein